MQRERLPYPLIPLAAFVAIIPLLLQGCSCGHDFDFHILSWFEAARQFTHGNLHPHWAFTPAYNAGEPRFVFYPPLSWTIGAILGLILPWTWTPIVYTWLALTASGLALYRLARDFTTSTAALLAATFYTVNPYMLFTAYERTAYAELLAAAWIPLLLHAILRSGDKGGVTIPRIAIPIALLWLTNAPAAVMSCYAIALLTVLRLATKPGVSSADSGGPSYAVSSHRVGYSRPARTAVTETSNVNETIQPPLQLALNTVTGTALGLGLAAFYILPAAYERRYVQIAMAIIPNMRIQDNFLFHHTGDIPHDQVLHTASLIATILLTTTAVVLSYLAATNARTPSTKPGAPSSARSLRLRWTSRESGSPSSAFARRGEASATAPAHLSQCQVIYALAILTIAIALLLTPLTQFIWIHALELAFLQFPWRLIAILAAILALSSALVFRPIQLNRTATAISITLIAAIFTYPAYALFHQACDAEDTVEARLALFHSNRGTEPTDEYTPITADNDSLAQTNPAYWLSPDPNTKAPSNSQPGPAPTHLTVNAPITENLILNLRDYPAWHIAQNGTPITTRLDRDDGLIALPIPAGPSTVDIAYAQTIDQTTGDAISLLSFVLLVFLMRRDYRRFHKT